ncbi:MAG: response regulator [Caulobacteraceae bacterium]|nr:response regulator [Caulobacteraceae bacterium]
MIENALPWFARSFRDTPVTIAVNLSASVLSDPQLPGWLFGCCCRFGIDPGQLILAIEETDAVAHQAKIARVAMQLRIYGFLFCINNFGVGYSSLLKLAQLPFSELKVDRRLVTQASVSGTSREDDWTLEFLTKKGCHPAQGSLIATPMDGVATLAWRSSRPDGRLRPGA